MSNPAIDRVIGEYAMQSQGAPVSTKPVTLDLVVQRTVISGMVLGIGVASGWFMGVSWGAGMAILFALTGMGLAFANIFMKPIRPILVLAYALVQGLFVGVLSNSLNSLYPGIAQQALLGASVAFGTMLVLYSMRIVRGGAKFMRILFISTISYGVFALISFISSRRRNLVMTSPKLRAPCSPVGIRLLRRQNVLSRNLVPGLSHLTP